MRVNKQKRISIVLLWIMSISISDRIIRFFCGIVWSINIGSWKFVFKNSLSEENTKVNKQSMRCKTSSMRKCITKTNALKTLIIYKEVFRNDNNIRFTFHLKFLVNVFRQIIFYLLEKFYK